MSRRRIGNDGIFDGNDDEVAEVLNVQADAFGQVFIDLTLIQGSYAYINAMEITAVPEPTSLLLTAVCVAGWGFSHRRRRQD